MSKLDASFLHGSNTAFIEALYDSYCHDPNSVEPSWRAYFGAINGAGAASAKATTAKPNGAKTNGAKPAAAVAAAAEVRSVPAEAEAGVPAATVDSIRALMLIRAHRVRGHLLADLDPLGRDGDNSHPELDPESYGFSEADYDRPIYVDGVLGMQWATLTDVVSVVRDTYCGRIGVEFMHIQDPQQKAWIQMAMEGSRNRADLSDGDKLEILRQLDEAEGFEHFLDIKHPGTKRFSLEGSESIVPALETLIEGAAAWGVRDITIGMSHRGRLNVLTSIMGKSYAAVFSEFQGQAAHPADVQGSGDVKYHLGVSTDRVLPDGARIHLSLTPNPSHLEAVNPVVLGKVRAKQKLLGDDERGQVMGILLHGDAAFAGQGMVAETLELSNLRGYRTGGTIHIIVNNQIGFTTSPSFARSSPYPSDAAKIIQTPIFHVNGDDPEAVVHVCRMAAEYRQRFHHDIVIDVFCYRRHGHNEGDEPAFTQPIMYRAIDSKATTRQIYSERLVSEGVLSETEAARLAENFQARLEGEMEASKSYKANKADWLEGAWRDMSAPPSEHGPGETAVEGDVLRRIGQSIAAVPEDFNLHPRLNRVLRGRRKMIESGDNIDWAMAEALAFGSLLLEGNPVRLSGQDCSRGTFSQRHAAFFDQQSEARYLPLNHIADGQEYIEIADSPLSEVGVLGFEYGYSTAEPNTLVLWEAQFGDFANGAQTVIDQFIASGESKWLRMSGLVMLLPHGHEGQGPEHSSARMERYLQLAAEGNIQVVNCTTPASFFHVLRRQMRRGYRKPLIVMSPKSLLRHKLCRSALEDLAPGSHFQRVIGEAPGYASGDDIRRVVLTSGKVYYDLWQAREERGIADVALLRMEQIAPFAGRSVTVELAKYGRAEIVWCQEEPQNQGAWSYVAPRIDAVLEGLGDPARRIRYVGRPEAASPASGSYKAHVEEQDMLVGEALA
ncbi:MAG: 2-oxoglutarate dehydrogenase E1 component [Alphaproteobacteria bacterium]|nr:2-oxoglutarate dehydrogenase E1 component [Alphaproteobacteria bacterium]